LWGEEHQERFQKPRNFLLRWQEEFCFRCWVFANVYADDTSIFEREHIFIRSIIADVERSVATEATQESADGFRFGGHSAWKKIDGCLARDKTNLRKRKRLLKEMPDIA
jgi:hypothetical protein